VRPTLLEKIVLRSFGKTSTKLDQSFLAGASRPQPVKAQVKSITVGSYSYCLTATIAASTNDWGQNHNASLPLWT
jgi:hypothetical protein